jgi:ribonuclease BN (tRNA processing enzyme)
MRLTALGTGVPRVMRSQYATSYLLQLGDGQSFLFDIGDVRRRAGGGGGPTGGKQPGRLEGST